MRSTATNPTPNPTLEELAQQIGLTEFATTSTPPLDQTPIAPDDAPESLSLDDYFEPEAEPHPETFATKPAFYNTGVSKAALVGGVGLLLFLGGASLFKLASPTGTAPPTVADTRIEEPPEDPTLAALRESQAAESRARAKLALLAQNQALNPTDGDATDGDAKAQATEPSQAADTKPKPTHPPIAKARPTPVAPPAPPPPARLTPQPTYSTVTPRPAAVTPPPRLNPGLTQRLTTVSTMPTERHTTPVDPMAEWQRLAGLGSYGQVDRRQQSEATLGGADANAKVAALFPGANGWGAASANDGAIGVDTTTSLSEDSALASPSTAAPLSDYFNRTSREVQLMSNWDAAGVDPAPAPRTEPTPPPERTILVGSSGQGHLVTPVLWAPDGSRGEARFIVTLSQPILDAQGQPALPADTRFVVAAQNLDPDSGLVDLTVTALLIDGQEYEAPEGVFSVRDRQGGLLLGQLRNQPNQGRGDTARILTGALAQVGKLMNRPRSTSTSRSNGSFGSSESSTTQNNDPNFVGAVLEGGFEEFASVIEERQKAAAEALAKAPQLYQLNANHPIQIFVNQSLSL